MKSMILKKALSKTSLDSDLGQESDVDENQRLSESPSNIIENRTKANALPNRDEAEREARKTNQIVS